jgi:serine/threonine-protein kinase RsbW
MISSLLEPRRQDAVPFRKWHRERLGTCGEIARILDKVQVAMAGCHYAEREIFAVRLALEEAMVNAIKHGHQGDPEKRVLVKFCVKPEKVLVLVKDQGAGFDPASVPDPCDPENLTRPTGRGLLLMQSYMNWLRHNIRGNCVTMCKCRQDGPAENDE